MLPITTHEELRAHAAILDGWYDRLGEAGRDFIETYKRLGTGEYYDPEHDAIACFLGVGLTKVTNAIIYGPRAVAHNMEQLFSFRTHEIIHAFQAHILAATHADPVNARSNIVLCPRDFIRLEELKERGAYAGQFLFASLMHDLETGARESVNFKIHDLPPEAERSIENMKQRMRDMVDGVMRRDNNDLKKQYNEQMLARFEEAAATDRKDDIAQGRLRFVRLEEEDIAAAGDGFILNIFTDGEGNVLPAFLKDVPLSPELEARVQILNKLLGITDESQLPTFGEALQAEGLDREAFITASITGKPGVPITKQSLSPFKPVSGGRAAVVITSELLIT